VNYHEIETYVFNRLVKEYEQKEFPVKTSPRIIGDAMQEWISDILDEFYDHNPQKFVHSDKLSRKAMADCIINDDGRHVIDIKTHCKSAHKSSPNLVSIKRLYDFFKKDQKNYFDLMIVDYSLAGNRIYIDRVRFNPITLVSWECMNIVNIGIGQLQLKDAGCIIYREDPEWWSKFMIGIQNFYQKQIVAIHKNMKYFGI